MSIDISKELKKYVVYVPYEKLQKAVEKPVSICPEEITAMLPSIIMGTDGPVLVSLFFITSHYLCEVDLRGQDESFDYISIDSIANYRFELSERVVKKTDEEEVRYQVAKIELLHEISLEFRSTVNYVGLEREKWIGMVTEAIPLSSIL